MEVLERNYLGLKLSNCSYLYICIRIEKRSSTLLSSWYGIIHSRQFWCGAYISVQAWNPLYHNYTSKKKLCILRTCLVKMPTSSQAPYRTFCCSSLRSCHQVSIQGFNLLYGWPGGKGARQATIRVIKTIPALIRWTILPGCCNLKSVGLGVEKNKREIWPIAHFLNGFQGFQVILYLQWMSEIRPFGLGNLTKYGSVFSTFRFRTFGPFGLFGLKS